MRVVLGQSYIMAGFITIFAAALSGYAGIGVWAIVVIAFALSMLSRAEYQDLYSEAGKAGLLQIARAITIQSVANAFMASSIAYAGGWVLRHI